MKLLTIRILLASLVFMSIIFGCINTNFDSAIKVTTPHIENKTIDYDIEKQPKKPPFLPTAGSGGSSRAPSRCGDGILGPHEACDDGNRAGEDGCDPNCKIEFPKCRWQCDDPVCPALCEPLCQPPRCASTCLPLMQPPNCLCDVKCEKPECEIKCPDTSCESDSCPQCETICKPIHCVTHCQATEPSEHCIAPLPECEVLCEEVQCAYKCHLPDCPKPTCELTCELPKPICQETK